MRFFSSQLATCFGIGRVSIAPGTLASAAALPLGWALVRMGWPIVVAGTIVATIIGIWACSNYVRKVGYNDPPECVIDEVAGQWFALMPIAVMGRSSDWWLYVWAFLLFRFFDIAKPWPISAGERLPGGLGVMMDDVLAGIAAAILLYGALVFRFI
jgi:phosphatidylglycerophosphatase A